MRAYQYPDPLNREITLRKENELKEITISLFREPYIIQPDAVRFVILGDLHGHMTQGLKKIERWQEYSNLSIDAILQVGDLGVMDDTTVLDKPTKKMSKKDPEELGFKKYYYGSEEADYYFGEKGIFSDIPFYFVNGNHDDINLLSEGQIGHYLNLQYIPDGKTVEIKGVKIGALGYHYSKSNYKKMETDILLTHDELNVEFLNPKYHFFGHYSDAVSKTVIANNQYGLNQTGIHYRKGTAGFLEIGEKSQFIYLPDNGLLKSVFPGIPGFSVF